MLGHATDVGTVQKIVSEIDHQGKLMKRHVSVRENRGRGLSHPNILKEPKPPPTKKNQTYVWVCEIEAPPTEILMDLRY